MTSSSGEQQTGDRGPKSAVLDRFLRRFFEDQDQGPTPPLEHYLTLFAGHEALIAKSYAALVEEGQPRSLGPGDALGPYQLLRELGRGGQSQVFLAEDSRAERQVALKVLHPSLSRDGGASIQRLRREAEAAARIQHPGICPVFEIDIEDQAPYVTMPYLEGPHPRGVHRTIGGSGERRRRHPRGHRPSGRRPACSARSRHRAPGREAGEHRRYRPVVPAHGRTGTPHPLGSRGGAHRGE